MLLETIITALRARCPTFSNRIAGAAEYKPLKEAQALQVPCAFVLPLDDSPQESRAQNSVRQALNDSFAVVVYVSNTTDEKGQTGMVNVNALRTELWAALLGWRPADRYDGITYEGGSLVGLDRARLAYQFEFGALMEIEPGDGWQETELAGLPHYDGGTLNLDAVDPADPSRVGTPSPDGRNESGFVWPKTGDLPT